MTTSNNDGRPVGIADPITMEVFSNRLLSITEDMGNMRNWNRQFYVHMGTSPSLST